MMTSLRHIGATTIAILFVSTMSASAQTPTTQLEALTFDHMHLAFPDPHGSTEWYIKYLGAAARPDGMDGVFFGPIRFNMRKLANPTSSDGATIDAIGLSYRDIAAELKMLDGSGAKVLEPVHQARGWKRMAIVEDPWGTKLELVEDPQLLGFHHVRLRVIDPVAIRSWFAQKLGGQPARFNGNDALTFGGIWLLIDKADAEPRPSEGTAIDHLGFRTKEINGELTVLAANGVKATGAPRQDPNVATTYATFIVGPLGRMELTQR